MPTTRSDHDKRTRLAEPDASMTIFLEIEAQRSTSKTYPSAGHSGKPVDSEMEEEELSKIEAMDTR